MAWHKPCARDTLKTSLDCYRSARPENIINQLPFFFFLHRITTMAEKKYDHCSEEPNAVKPVRWAIFTTNRRPSSTFSSVTAEDNLTISAPSSLIERLNEVYQHTTGQTSKPFKNGRCGVLNIEEYTLLNWVCSSGWTLHSTTMAAAKLGVSVLCTTYNFTQQ
jgi:hypothetical protein